MRSSIMKKGIKQKPKKKNLQLQRLLLDPIPQTPIPQPYFTIPSPDPYRFPLGQTMLQGIKLLQNYFPQDINQTIQSRLGYNNVQRMSRYNDIYCMMGKQGNGLIIGNQFMNVKDVTAYSYGPNYLLVVFKDLRLDLYTLQMKLIKSFKKFFSRATTFVKLLSIPKGYENILFLSHDNRDVYIHRLDKSLLSKYSSKLNKKIIENLQHPIIQMFELPKYFRNYLKNDVQYKQTSLICISSINRVDIVRINHFRLDLQKFWDIVYTKKVQQLGSNVVAWGQTKIQAPSRQLNGQRLVLVCTFGSKIIFLALNQQYIHTQNDQIASKLQWIQSYPFTLKNSQVAFCQFLKKNQFIIITNENNVLIFNTKNFEIFQKPISSDQFQIFTQKFDLKLASRLVKTIQIKSQKKVIQEQNKKIKSQIPDLIFQLKKRKTRNMGWQQQSRSQQQSLTQNSQFLSHNLSFLTQPDIKFKPILTFTDSFTYQYPSSQINYLIQSQNINFGVYVYCDWKLISDLLRLDKKYQECMLFLIAIKKGANKFQLNVKGNQEQIEKYVQDLAIEFVNKVIMRMKNQKVLQENIQNLLIVEEHFKTFIKPIQFLCQTSQFTFLFQNLQQKLIASIMSQHIAYHKQYHKCRKIFFTALIKFIQHGRIKYIPQSHLQLVFDYYIQNDRIDIIDRLAIYFDLNKIDTATVVQCLLQNDLTVSLAHICIQGTESLFVTPFVKFWGVSANYKYLGQMENATVYAIRSLWYVKLCLQRNWALKEYSFQKYAKLISVLSNHFLSQKIIIAMLQIRPQQCLQTLNYYFNIQNSMIVNQQMDLNTKKIQINPWICHKQDNQTLQQLLSAINIYISKANLTGFSSSSKTLMNIFLSNILIYRSIRLQQQKYYEILISLIQNYKQIKQIKYGLQDKLLQQLKQQYQYNFSQQQIDEVLSSRYIIRILTLIYYQKSEFIKNRLISIYEKSRQYNLMDLQAEICMLNNQYNNAVDIYLRAKPNLRIWIFEFLSNAFKNLILEKKKVEKKRLGDILTSRIKSLVELDSTKTKQIVDKYLPQIQQQLIQVLADNQELQLQYMQQIINSTQSTNNKSRLSNKMILRYVQLMSYKRPDQLFQSFKKNTYFPIDQCIKICQQQQVYDCLQYLYERSGASKQAVKIAMKRIDRILMVIMQQNEEYLQENFTRYIKIKQILDHSIQVCKITRSQQTWQSLLDSSIQLYNKYLNSSFPQDQIQIFFYINGQIMQHLASNCQITHTIDLLQNKYQNLNMGGKMTKAFMNLLANLSHSINIMFIAENMIEKTYQNLLIEDYYRKISGVGGEGECKACKYGIMRRKKSKHYQCHHSYHNQCTLMNENNSSSMCVYCLLHQSDQFQFHINSIQSPMHPKLAKMKQIFNKFNSQSQQILTILNKEDQDELNKKQDNVIITNVQKKKKKMKGFDQMIKQTEDGNRRVLKGLRMY